MDKFQVHLPDNFRASFGRGQHPDVVQKGDDGASFVIDDDDRHEKEEEDNDEDGGILDFIANVAIDAVECVGL